MKIFNVAKLEKYVKLEWFLLKKKIQYFYDNQMNLQQDVIVDLLDFLYKHWWFFEKIK